jgi:hypothetical protein
MFQSGEKGGLEECWIEHKDKFTFTLPDEYKTYIRPPRHRSLRTLKTKLFALLGLLVRHRRFGTAFQPHIQGSRWPAKNEA